MAEDIFGFTSKVGAGFKESETGVIIGGNTLSLVQQWSVQYAQQAQPIYECGTSTVYFASKHAAGTFQCQRIVSSSFKEIQETLGTLCARANPIIMASSGRCEGENGVDTKLTLTGSFLAGVNYNGQATQPYVGEGLSSQFVSLEIR